MVGRLVVCVLAQEHSAAEGSGGHFADNSAEWPEVQAKQRREYLFLEHGIIYVIGEVLVGVTLTLSNRPNWGESLFLAALFVGAVLLLLLLHLIPCRIHIWQSNAHYQKRQLMRAGYGATAAAEAMLK
jgi:protein-S-isoprenylcysteine O-methyltransferase Ste14